MCYCLHENWCVYLCVKYIPTLMHADYVLLVSVLPLNVGQHQQQNLNLLYLLGRGVAAPLLGMECCSQNQKKVILTITHHFKFSN